MNSRIPRPIDRPTSGTVTVNGAPYSRHRAPLREVGVLLDAKAVHKGRSARAHLLAIPYENLDIHLGRRVTLDPDATFDKLVDDRRGGWCFEMNGLLGRVLETLGFEVRYLSGAVGRAAHGWRAQMWGRGFASVPILPPPMPVLRCARAARRLPACARRGSAETRSSGGRKAGSRWATNSR